MVEGRWSAIERLYHTALAQPVDQRAAFVADACAGDEKLRRQVESLLAQDASAVAVLAGGAVAVAAGMVSDAWRSVLSGRRLGGAYQQIQP